MIADLKTSCDATFDGVVLKLVLCSHEDRDSDNLAILGFVVSDINKINDASGKTADSESYGKLTQLTCPLPNWNRREQLGPLLQYLSSNENTTLRYGTYTFINTSPSSESSELF